MTVGGWAMDGLGGLGALCSASMRIRTSSIPQLEVTLGPCLLPLHSTAHDAQSSPLFLRFFYLVTPVPSLLQHDRDELRF